MRVPTVNSKIQMLFIKLFKLFYIVAYPPPVPMEMYPSPRMASYQSCTGSTGSKPCCHDRFCTVRPWFNSRLALERRPEKTADQMHRILQSMESSHLKGNKKDPLEMLARLFPKQSIRTLKRVLDLCQGDPVFAIERMLDRYPSDMDIDDVAMTSNGERQERRLFGIEDEAKPNERRIHSGNDDHLSKLAMAYDIPLSLGKVHRDESLWEPNNRHNTHAASHGSELREKRERPDF